ncbi:MAG TPA: triphosphoribosyl-dephospho-CoA synthase [Candidatus Limnocylindrales bacterium]|nr:triphosphoribosyl-dephospho-CoA synthase [Candidatus Limnocylindrales bacterium]
MTNREKAQYISRCFQLGILLEVSAEKPGNVNFTTGFEDTTCQHFLASAIAAGASFQEAANRGTLVAENKLAISKIGLGQLIKTCVSDVNDWQKGGNTILGTIMLLMPMAVAAGMTPAVEDYKLDFSLLRRNIDLAVKSTTAKDSVHLYEAVDIANPSGLNSAPDLDVTDSHSKERLIKEDVTLFEVFRLASAYDDICAEWVNNYPVTFDLAYSYLIRQLKTRPLNTAVVHTFLKILSERPDTFITRKLGKEKALEVSAEAKAVLKLGGLETAKGKASLERFDRKLRSNQNKCNPGTTADLTAAALALCTLSVYRP